jgi:transcriptional regulator GlxA family with amidase domain
MSTTTTLRIGVLIPEEVQLLDLASVDLFSLLSRDYLARCGLPEEIVSRGIPKVQFFYIADKTAGDHQETTARARIRLTHAIGDEEVRPGSLDIILVPGPFPPANTTKDVKAWAQAHNAEKTVFLIVCTGSFVAGNCGVLDGKHATGPRPLEAELRKLYPLAKWDFSKRWLRDDNVWSSGKWSKELKRDQRANRASPLRDHLKWVRYGFGIHQGNISS